MEFTIYVSLSPDPPPPLLVIPQIPQATDSRKQAIYATVDVSTETGGASGTLVCDDGLVLTNYHVIEEVAENADSQDPVVIAVTLDLKAPPRELFRGKVVAFDKTSDLALVRITGGYYHQPLPKDYRFPAITLGDPAKMEIGDPVTTLGFPEIGSTTGRGSVTLTHGVISGFEKTEAGLLMKADASIGPGSSGGAAVERLLAADRHSDVAERRPRGGRPHVLHPSHFADPPRLAKDDAATNGVPLSRSADGGRRTGGGVRGRWSSRVAPCHETTKIRGMPRPLEVTAFASRERAMVLPSPVPHPPPAVRHFPPPVRRPRSPVRRTGEAASGSSFFRVLRFFANLLGRSQSIK